MLLLIQKKVVHSSSFTLNHMVIERPTPYVQEFYAVVLGQAQNIMPCARLLSETVCDFKLSIAS